MPGLPVVIPTLRIRSWKQHLPIPAHELGLISLLSNSFTPSICVSPSQISSHVKAIDAIYQGTDFMGIRNISFMVKRIRVSLAHFSLSLFLSHCVKPTACLPPSGLTVAPTIPLSQINTTTDEKDRSNPFRFPNIGVEKFLELNSEQNHDDYCLAYVFTDRDFDDGVLGLAWVGAPSGNPGQSTV